MLLTKLLHEETQENAKWCGYFFLGGAFVECNRAFFSSSLGKGSNRLLTNDLFQQDQPILIDWNNCVVEPGPFH